MSLRAVIYARVSTDMQRDNFSIPSQISECMRYGQKHGYTIVGDRFVDPETGRDTVRSNGAIPAFVDDFTSRELSRPGIDAALNYLETVGFDVLIVHALDRLARDPYIRQTLEREVNLLGARVEYVLGNYEETPEGDVRKDLDATFAKWENAKRVERCNRGKRRKAESGLFVAGRSPYGYRINKDKPGGLEIVSAEAEVVVRVFQLYVMDGYSLKQIARILSDDGVTPQLGGDKWGTSSIRKMLQNTLYIGYFYFNKYKRVGKKLIERDVSEWIRVQTTPIIDEWLFEQAQRKLAENKTSRRAMPTRFYMLTGMVVCDHCGRPYFTQTAKAGKNRRLNDASNYRHRAIMGHCTNHTVSGRRLEQAVWAEVTAIIQDPDKLREGYYASLEQQKASRARQEGHLETLRKALIKLEQQKQNLTALYIDPDIQMTRNEYLEQRGRIDDEIQATNGDIEAIESELSSIPTPADFESLEKFASKIRTRLAGDYELRPEDKRRVLELLHVKVYIGLDGSIRLDGWYGDAESQGQKDSACLLSTTSEHYARPPQPPPGRA